MKNLKYSITLMLALVFATSCEITTINNPNGPTIEELTSGASLVDLQLLASGLEAVMRNDIEFYYWTTSIVGREYYDLRGTDPRYTGELLGAQGAVLDNNGFLTTRHFASRYRTIRNAYLLETATANSSAGLSTAQNDGLLGFSKTLRAYNLLLVLNHQYQNGCRLDTSDPDNLGAFSSYEEGLTGVMSLLDEAAAQLASGELPITSTIAEDAAEMRAFNRGIAARVAMYQGDKSKMLTLLSESSLDLADDMDEGFYHEFGGAVGNDQPNPLFTVTGQTFYMAGSDWLANIEMGDARVSEKTTQLADAVTLDGLTGDVQVTMFESNTSPIPIIRTEELILMYAEANVGSNNADAIDAINIVRAAAGLSAYAGGTDDADVMAAIMHERRYSLFGEGHYWLDMRRTGNLANIVVDRAGDVVHTQFPRPILEEE